MAGIAITRTDMSAADLRAAAKRSSDAKQASRVLAIAMVLDGFSREDAARLCGMDRQTLCDWIHRYNEAGLGGLADRARSGRPASLSWVEQGKVASWVEEGADLARDGVELHERSVGKLLRRLDFRHLSVRPQHPQSDPAAQETFKKNFADLAKSALGTRAIGKLIEIWFQDEARVGQQGTLTRIWARRGTRPRALRDRRFNWAYLFGAVCPARGVGAALVLPTVNIEAMNKHLIEIGKCVSAGAIALLVVDGAGWHSSPKLVVPENIVLLKLPPYAPELNPTE